VGILHPHRQMIFCPRGVWHFARRNGCIPFTSIAVNKLPATQAHKAGVPRLLRLDGRSLRFVTYRSTHPTERLVHYSYGKSLAVMTSQCPITSRHRRSPPALRLQRRLPT